MGWFTRRVGLILMPAVLLSGCGRDKPRASASSNVVEAQIMLTAAYGSALPEGVRLAAAQKLQRTLAAEGWPNVETEASTASQITLRIPIKPGQVANKAVSDLQALQTVAPVQFIPLSNVCYRTVDGVVGPLFAPVEYIGAQRFREIATGRLVQDAEAVGGPISFSVFARVQVTGADFLPGSVSLPAQASGKPREISFQIRPGHLQDWLVASRSLHVLVIGGKIVGVFGPHGTEESGSTPLTGTMRVKPGSEESATVTLDLPPDAGSVQANEISVGLARGAVPPPPVNVRVLYAGPRLNQDMAFRQGPPRRRRGRFAQIEYTLPERFNGRLVTSHQCAQTVRAIEERARAAGVECNFEADGTRRITGWVRMFRGPRRTPGTSSFSRVIQRGEWAILRVGPHGSDDGIWSPTFQDGWVIWRRNGAAETIRACRIDAFEKYLRADPRNVLLTSSDAVPVSAIADTGNGLEGSPASVTVVLKPDAGARWKSLRAQSPNAVAAVFLDGVLISRFRVSERPLTGNSIAILRSRVLPMYVDTAPSGRGIWDGDAQALAGLLNLSPIPLPFTSAKYRLVDRDAGSQ